MMGVVRVVLLVLLVWTFTSVCVADDDIISYCEDVTAPVGDEITLTCTVSNLIKDCCMTLYKFINTAAADDPTICREDFRYDSCKQESRFLCPYTAKKPMTTTFKFYLQTICGQRTTEFSVIIRGIIINCEDVTAYVGDEKNLACTVSSMNQNCYMTMYKFTDTAADDICKEQFSKDLSNQESRFSCPYTADKPMTTKFKFFLQTTCGQRTTEFSLSTSDITINCEDVTAPVGAEINLACNVSHLNQICYTTMYKFTDTAAGDICKEQFSKDLSKQESRVSCPYTAKSTMTRKFKFHLQTTCGQRTTDFIVKITDIKINCEDVTARVGDEINLTCTVRYLNKRCCGMMYKFIDTVAADDDPTICREDFRRDSCKQELRYSCPYTANKAMTATLKFFLQSNCGSHTRLFSANIAGAVKDETGKPSEEPPVQTTDKTTIAVIICLLSCFVIVIVALILWKRWKTPPPDYNMAARENNINEHS